MAMTRSASDAQPMGEMNTTPLIDVLLVLLIMFIMVIPAATHSVDLDLPTACETCPLPDLEPTRNKIVIDGGDQLYWNGEAIDQRQLTTLLSVSRDLPVEPELQFEPAADASYAASSRTLATIKASGVTKFGFVGNERYRQF